MAHSHSPAPSSYSDCVASLRTSLTLLESSVDALGAGVADFPRLGSVLKTVRVRTSNITTQPPRLRPPLALGASLSLCHVAHTQPPLTAHP